MTRRWLILTTTALVLLMGPVLLISDAQTRCPWSIQLQMQQKAKQLHQDRLLAQQMEQMRRQQQISQMKKPQPVQRYAPPVVAKNFTPPAPKRPVVTTPSRPVQIATPTSTMTRTNLTTTTKSTQTTTTTSVGIITRGFALANPTVGVDTRGVGITTATRGIDTRTVGVTRVTRTVDTRTVGVTKVTRGIDTRTVGVTKLEVAPTVRFTAPVTKTVGVTKGPTVAPVKNQVGPRNLVLADPVGQARKKPIEPLAKKPGQAGMDLPLVKMNFSCVQCHKKMKIDMPDAVAKAPAMPTGLQRPKPAQPLPNPVDCPPPPKMNQPIAGVRPQAPVVKKVPQPLPAPINMPVVASPILQRPWMINQPGLPMPIAMAPGEMKFRTPIWDATGRIPGLGYADPLAPAPSGQATTGRRRMPKEVMPDWTVPDLPPTSSGSSLGEHVLLPKLEPTPERPKRPAPEPTEVQPGTPLVPSFAVGNDMLTDLDGPTLPPLPTFALIVPSRSAGPGEAKSDDWYASQPLPRATSPTWARADLDTSRPPMAPLPTRALLPF